MGEMSTLVGSTTAMNPFVIICPRTRHVKMRLTIHCRTTTLLAGTDPKVGTRVSTIARKLMTSRRTIMRLRDKGS